MACSVWPRSAHVTLGLLSRQAAIEGCATSPRTFPSLGAERGEDQQCAALDKALLSMIDNTPGYAFAVTSEAGENDVTVKTTIKVIHSKK
ncbi:hypothetical protein GW7_21067 [Heterocephalus glaber]|uniref:Uncharacterized protein n=1 Tax=Heterocephalus glaber TaxID=10181 RepID=G5C5H1_HETGA|nr:hypothetical protein GW7_21067 [Heterocephalus glaber]